MAPYFDKTLRPELKTSLSGVRFFKFIVLGLGFGHRKLARMPILDPETLPLNPVDAVLQGRHNKVA